MEKRMETKTAPPAAQKLTNEQKIRQAVNEAAVNLVGQGFQAIDEMAELGKDWLKRRIIEGISGQRKNRK
jgi:hypothetical protein